MTKEEMLKWLLNLPLYSPQALTEANIEVYKGIYNQKVHLYCPNCERDSVFTLYLRSYSTLNSSPFSPRIRDYVLSEAFWLTCGMDESHTTHMIFTLVGENLLKIGQYPSIADLQMSKKDIYKMLPEVYRKELSKAIGLFSHGIGIGSFVYLRRIFEYLINEAYDIAKKEPDFDNEVYERSRMDEKVLILKDHLPKLLTEERAIYSILSKGIHELEEDECSRYFEAIRGCIEIILKQDLDKKEEAIQISSTKRLIQDIKSSLTKV